VLGEGLGPGFCFANGGYPFGASLGGVYACGPSQGPADAFDTVGFQCVELSERFLWDAYHKVIKNVDSGADLVSLGHRQLHIPIGLPGRGSLPAQGDVLSLSGPTADPNGHTAVVASVNVDRQGNGTIQILEENGSLSGWDEVNVSHWRETFGDPRYDAGLYYYTDISWLKLATARTPRLRGALAGRLHFTIQTLGPSSSAANGIDPAGDVAGMTDVKDREHTPEHRVLIRFGSSLHTLSPPAGDQYLTSASGISKSGWVAAWSIHTGGQPYPYAVYLSKKPRWLRLVAPQGGPAVGETEAMDPAGDIAGWTLDHTGTASNAVVWYLRHGRFQARPLWPNRYFHYAVANATDHLGDVVGTETLGTSRTSAVYWTPGGQAIRLPALAGRPILDVAAGLSTTKRHGRRVVLIVGSSVTSGGRMVAVEWRVRIRGGRIAAGKPQPLLPLDSRSSWATAVNSRGWVIGGVSSAALARHAFLYRPGLGAVDLDRLLEPEGRWLLFGVDGLNAKGQITGEAISRLGSSHPVAAVLTPKH